MYPQFQNAVGTLIDGTASEDTAAKHGKTAFQLSIRSIDTRAVPKVRGQH